MAQIKPFKGIRPVPKYVSRVATLPYDVYSEKEARDIVSKNPMSFLKIVRPETAFPKGTDAYSDKVYEKAAKLIETNIKKGIFTADEDDCYYIYREIMNGRSQTGLVACFSVDDYLNGVIRKHENTRPDKEDDRTRHIDTCSAQTGLVFMAFRDEEDIRTILEQSIHHEPLYEFVSEDNVLQLVWKVDDPDRVARITRAFERTGALYIADGHHRAASAATVCQKRRDEHPDYTGDEEFNYFLGVAFPHEELKIMPYNRVVADLNGLSDKLFLELVSRKFEVKKIRGKISKKDREGKAFMPRTKGEFSMYLGGRWYRLKAKPEIASDDPVKGLDVMILQENILDPILGIRDPRTNSRIDFVGGAKGLSELERRCRSDMEAAFALYPTSMDELFGVTDRGEVMPPKSTWFEPKLQSGLFIHKFES